jgi:hypothetical protein
LQCATPIIVLHFALLVAIKTKEWHHNAMDVLRSPLLSDEHRKSVFFHGLPELFLGEYLNELKHYRFFAYNRIDTLENFDLLNKRKSFSFERVKYQEVYEKFKNSFDKLRDFTEENFFVEGEKVVLNSTLKKTKPIQYQKLADELDELCRSVVNSYHVVTEIFSKDELPIEPKTSVRKVGNTLKFDDKQYVVGSKHRQNLLNALWGKRCKKPAVKNATWTDGSSVAVFMNLTDSSNKFTDKQDNRLQGIVRDFNAYLKKKGYGMKIRRNSDGQYLIVVDN